MNEVTEKVAAADRAAASGDFGRAEGILAYVTGLVPRRPDLWKKLAACRRALRRPTDALSAIDAALSIDPRDPIALLMKGAVLESIGQDAQEPYRAALAFLPDPDKLPRQLRVQVDHAVRKVREADSLRSERLARALAQLATSLSLSDVEKRRIEAFATVIAANDPVTVLPDLARPDFFDPGAFRHLPAIAHGYGRYLAEYIQFSRKGGAGEPYVNHPAGVPLDQWETLNGSTAWTAVHLLGGGKVLEAAASCPSTMTSWQRLSTPAIEGRSPNLMFSILAPGTHIPRHQGMINARLVVHVPLVIPEGCWMTVGNDGRQWVPGEALVFDDTIPHEARNDSSQVRVVLIGDVWHPDLSDNERRAISSLMSLGRPAAAHGPGFVGGAARGRKAD